MTKTPQQVRLHLKEFTQLLFSSETSYIELKDALDTFKNLLIEVSELNLESEDSSENVLLKKGKAIGTKWAAMCIEDLIRTKKFISAVKKAIDRKLDKDTSKPVTLLYAGTGPFATLVLPLTSLYSPQQLQLVLLEVNEFSFTNLCSLLNKLELNDYIQTIEKVDATEYVVENPNIDILLIECLQHALLREPQVAITLNLVPQLQPGVILIPEKISLHLCLVNSRLQYESLTNLDAEGESFYESIFEVFTLNKESCSNPESLLSEKMFTIDSEINKEYNQIAVFTEMQLFEDEILNFNESGLTLPLTIAENPGLKIGDKIVSKYLLNEDPRLDIKIKPIA
ncbi:MAG: hypothetical protein HKN48_11945 [Flavobacteriaceae bacterium]|nr:hypothetical protein [Flavobacteriaceae bacterium]